MLVESPRSVGVHRPRLAAVEADAPPAAPPAPPLAGPSESPAADAAGSSQGGAVPKTMNGEMKGSQSCTAASSFPRREPGRCGF